jgi:Na+/melibiose symporter-like transporter
MIVPYLFAAACALLVVSLPIARTSIGSMLRRCAGALFLLAIVPAVFMALVGSLRGGTTHSAPEVSLHAVGCVVSVALLSLLAYAVLELRKRLSRPKQDAWSEYIHARSAGKTVVRDRNKQPGLPVP